MSDNTHTDVELALLRADMDQMKDDVKALRQEVKDLLDAWKTASGVVTFVKMLAGFVGACAFIWALFKAKLGI